LKNKFIRWLCLFILIGTIISTIGVVKRYKNVNKDYQDKQLISQKKIEQNQLISVDAVEFVVDNSVVRLDSKYFYSEVTVSLLNKKKNNYGFKKNNLNFIENMFLNIPYSISIPAMHIKNSDGTLFKLEDVQLSKSQKFTIYFKTPIENYRQRKEPVYFNFLIPEKNNRFTNYYVLLLENSNA